MNPSSKISTLVAATVMLTACATGERLDRPKPLKQASLDDLLTRPKEFHLHKVTVSGFLSYGPPNQKFYEGCGLYLNEEDARKNRYEKSVSIGNFLFDLSEIPFDPNNRWVHVTGMFRNPPGGHMGLWSGELLNIESIMLAAPEATARR